MKNTIFLLITLMFLASCELLDVKPQLSIDADMAITTKADLERAITGCYDAFQSGGYYGRNFIVAGDLAADNLIWTGTTVDYKQIRDNAIISNNTIIEGIWASIYTAINRINYVLSKVEAIENLSLAEQNKYKGELLFLRGLAYFDLVRLFGGVPLRINPVIVQSDVHIARSSVVDVYERIISDLRKAAEWLPQAATPVKAGKHAAAGMLAKVYLYRYYISGLTSDLDSAVYFSSSVISSSSYQLIDYAQLFPANASAESIFEIAFNVQDNNRMAQYMSPVSLGGRKEFSPAPDLETAFSASDVRKNVSLFNAPDGKYCGKYTDIAGGSDNVYVLRLAELYLIRAEANALLNMGASAVIPDIQIIRNRAGLTNPISASTQNELLLAIEHERRLEFAFEGQRWHDLVRTNRAIDVKPEVMFTWQYLFPIPLSELLTNNLFGNQNPGY